MVSAADSSLRVGNACAADQWFALSQAIRVTAKITATPVVGRLEAVGE